MAVRKMAGAVALGGFLLDWYNEVASVINLSEASVRLAAGLFQIHPPTIGTLVTGMGRDAYKSSWWSKDIKQSNFRNKDEEEQLAIK